MDTTDDVMVQALEPYMEGREFKNAQSKPYRLARHIAMELEANRFAKVLGDAEPLKPAAPPPPPPVDDDETEVEQPDDTSRASVTQQPVAAAHGGPLSTVPAKPGAEPVTPTTPAVARRGRGRPARAKAAS